MFCFITHKHPAAATTVAWFMFGNRMLPTTRFYRIAHRHAFQIVV